MSDQNFVRLQYVLPKQALTALAGRFANARAGRLTTAAIRWFIERYGVNMAEAANPDPSSYATFNDFFTRPLHPGARPIAKADFLCPVDGSISQFGPIQGDQMLQAKGHRYSTASLLGGNADLAAEFANGSFATLYLSPRDYHRIHMPCAGQLQRMIHVPGSLFSVNPATAEGVPGLFARNERVICVFEGEFGPFILVLVGATIVGSVATPWHGVVTPPRDGALHAWSYDDAPIPLARAEEMGRFLLGSTVIVLFPPDTLRFNSAWHPGAKIRMGSVMGERPGSKTRIVHSA